MGQVGPAPRATLNVAPKSGAIGRRSARRERWIDAFGGEEDVRDARARRRAGANVLRAPCSGLAGAASRSTNPSGARVSEAHAESESGPLCHRTLGAPGGAASVRRGPHLRRLPEPRSGPLGLGRPRRLGPGAGWKPHAHATGLAPGEGPADRGAGAPRPLHGVLSRRRRFAAPRTRRTWEPGGAPCLQGSLGGVADGGPGAFLRRRVAGFGRGGPWGWGEGTGSTGPDVPGGPGGARRGRRCRVAGPRRSRWPVGAPG